MKRIPTVPKRKKLKYAKSQRHRIYKKALTKLSSCWLGCLCWAIMDVIEPKKEKLIYGLLNDFPEILKHEPKNEHGFWPGGLWFPACDLTPRRKILREAVKETAPKKSKP